MFPSLRETENVSQLSFLTLTQIEISCNVFSKIYSSCNKMFLSIVLLKKIHLLFLVVKRKTASLKPKKSLKLAASFYTLFSLRQPSF